MVSERVAADPFTKVKKMVKDLIWKLMEEATAETEHKGWCDTELGTNKQTRETKTEQVNELTATEEDLTANIASLAQAIETLTEEIAVLSSEMAKATEDRADSKATNEQTIADAKEAQTAMQQAIAILKDYYATSAQATALAQQTPAEDAPETFDKPYKGMLPEGGNVIDFLEVILTDFARLESETTTAEATELDAYKKYMFESEKDKALKENEKGHKEAKKSELESTLQQTIEDLKATQEALDAAITYYEKLKPTCVDSGATYEDRVKRREDEIQSLKEALGILQGTDIDLA
jgi:predicted  nucleic acid-binding Zn-ribbon protein